MCLFVRVSLSAFFCLPSPPSGREGDELYFGRVWNYSFITAHQGEALPIRKGSAVHFILASSKGNRYAGGGFTFIGK
jgi:hypothetical protein